MDKKFQEFINYAFGNRDIGLAISEDGMELAGWEEQLIKTGWKKADNAVALLGKMSSGGKYYLLFNQFTPKENFKPAYDLACQYPVGQVVLFDEKQMANLPLSPNYDQTGIIYLFTATALEQAKADNFQFIGVCGLTFKN